MRSNHREKWRWRTPLNWQGVACTYIYCGIAPDKLASTGKPDEAHALRPQATGIRVVLRLCCRALRTTLDEIKPAHRGHLGRAREMDDRLGPMFAGLGAQPHGAAH